jgi:thioredoxin reductase
MAYHQTFDVIIIGGSYAGLSAAMALGRSLRKVLLIDSGKPCNAQTPHSHNFLTQDGKTPAEIAALAREQVAAYDTVKFFQGLAVTGKKTDNGFDIGAGSGEVFSARKIILATGIKDELPPIAGLAECWGISVIHCPYCHGYEYRGRKTGILANGDVALHYAPLIRNLTSDLTLFTNGPSSLSAEQAEKLWKRSIHIVEWEVTAITHEAGHIQHVVFRDGSNVRLDALYTRPPFAQHSDIAASLGCAFTEAGHIQVDAFQKTTVPDVFACGDNSSMMRSVANAVAAGNFSGTMANRELATEEF